MQTATALNAKYLAVRMQFINKRVSQLIVQEDLILNKQGLEKLECEVQALTKQLGNLIDDSYKPVYEESYDEAPRIVRLEQAPSIGS